MSKPVDTVATTSTPIDALANEHRDALNAWCAEVLSLRAVAKQFDSDADKIVDDNIKPLLAELGIKNSIASAAWTLVRSKGRATLSATKLLENGVPMAVIEKSKTTGDPSWSLKGKDDKSGDDKGDQQ